MRYFGFLWLVVFSVLPALAQQVPPQIQIKTAVLAAPPDQREEATVMGYDEQGNLVLLQKGKNNLVCMADDPKEPGIKVSCYSKKLEPFIARGRELTAAGKTEMEKRKIREEEADAGQLQLPKEPSMMYILSADQADYDPDTGELNNGHFRYVIYIPYATTESTGLPAKPFAPGMPWLMDPGTHRAHIMITPAGR